MGEPTGSGWADLRLGNGKAMPAICSIQLNLGELSFWGSGSQEEWWFFGPSGAGVSLSACSCSIRLGVVEMARCPTEIRDRSRFPYRGVVTYLEVISTWRQEPQFLALAPHTPGNPEGSQAWLIHVSSCVSFLGQRL